MAKNILITGSTDGIGKLAAIDLAKQGHNVYLHGRNPAKLETVIAEIIETVQPTGEISGFVADFSDMNSVRKMAEEVKTRLLSLDVLINNAGIFKVANSITKDGLDVRLAVNYFAPYILTEAVLSSLKNAKNARIVNLSSAAQGTVSMAGLAGKQTLEVNSAYAQSKLALTMWSFDLAKRVVADGITVIAVNPGSLLNTRMANEAYGKSWSSADKGSNILVGLATEPEFEGETGKYFDNDLGDKRGVFAQAHEDAYNETLISQLLQETKSILNSI